MDTGLLSSRSPFLLADHSPVSKDSSHLTIEKNYLRQQARTLKVYNNPGYPSQKRAKSILALNSGIVSYGFDYRSNIDTPFLERNIAQHQVLSSLSLTVARILPLRVNAFFRRSNSGFFRDINDVQVQFDGIAFQNRLKEYLYEQMLSQVTGAKDTISERLFLLKQLEAKELEVWLQDPSVQQRIVEANEIMHVPQLAFDAQLPDSVNKARADSLQLQAQTFMEKFQKTRDSYDKKLAQADSLKAVYEQSLKRMKRLGHIIRGQQFSNGLSYDRWKKQVQEQGGSLPEIPAKYRWLLGIRNLGLGKNMINSSELTARNINVSGINFEYNSWYYLAFTGGVVDYRFRDFALTNVKRTPQYLYLLRFGIGRIEQNYFIVSAFRGQKQLYASTSLANKLNSITVSGLSLESKWQFGQHTYLITEVAQSVSKDVRTLLARKEGSKSLLDKRDKALSVKVQSSFKDMGLRLEARYRFAGADYQAFNSFQTNAQLRSWHVKGDQNFFGKQLKLTASLSSNDFSNPYILQKYKTNTVFKSLNATLRLRKWPILSAGYIPMTQVVLVDGQLAESRFQALNGSLSHYYKLGLAGASTSAIYSQFFNQAADTGFLYYNSTTLFINQSLFFKDFSVNVAVSHSRNSGYRYKVMEEGAILPIGARLRSQFGAKIHQLNRTNIKVGGYLGAEVIIFQNDLLVLRAEKTYLPGSGNSLLRTALGSVHFTKTLK